jgi:hypothetical protein
MRSLRACRIAYFLIRRPFQRICGVSHEGDATRHTKAELGEVVAIHPGSSPFPKETVLVRHPIWYHKQMVIAIMRGPFLSHLA